MVQLWKDHVISCKVFANSKTNNYNWPSLTTTSSGLAGSWNPTTSRLVLQGWGSQNRKRSPKLMYFLHFFAHYYSTWHCESYYFGWGWSFFRKRGKGTGVLTHCNILKHIVERLRRASGSCFGIKSFSLCRAAAPNVPWSSKPTCAATLSNLAGL